MVAHTARVENERIIMCGAQNRRFGTEGQDARFAIWGEEIALGEKPPTLWVAFFGWPLKRFQAVIVFI